MLDAVQEISSTEARELFERRKRAWLDEDAQAYLELWSDEMVIEIPGRAEPIRGKSAYAKLIQESMRAMRPVAWEFHSLAVDGDRVLAEWTIESEYREAARRIRWRGMSICRVEDGLIREWREYWDPGAMRR